MSEQAVSFDNVTKVFGAVRAVDGLRVSIERGESVALLGPNGAGKSTTVNLLLGLLSPDEGRVEVLGDSPDLAVARGRIGAMVQDGGLMPGATVRRVVELASRIYPAGRPVEELLERADLAGIAGRRVDRISGGQAQRVRFAMAIAGDPEVLVLDEPTAAMDVVSRRAFWASIREYAASGRTVLFATHYLEEADENADRIVVVSGGRVARDGTPTQIKAAAGGGVVRFTIGQETCVCLDVLPGVPAALRSAPDVALLDIEMPGMDGLAAAADLHRALPDCRVLILTTFGRPGYLRRAMESGASGFLVKDGPVDELVAAIHRVLDGHKVINPTLAAAALSSGPSPLSARERDVLAAAADGTTITDIAGTLHVSEGTVRNYLSAAIGKTGARNRLEVARIALHNGWL
jgi:ABC-2 type transport system ATP-binding protein